MEKFVGCFLTGTAAEITPVSKIQNFNFKVCDLIKDLSESYQNLVRKKICSLRFIIFTQSMIYTFNHIAITCI